MFPKISVAEAALGLSWDFQHSGLGATLIPGCEAVVVKNGKPVKDFELGDIMCQVVILKDFSGWDV